MQNEKPTKEKIKIAALKLFAEKGLKATTVRDVSHEADVNVSSIIYHFESKENLYRTIIEEYSETNSAFALEVLMNTPENKEEFSIRIKTFSDLLIKSVMKNPEIHTLMEREFQEGLPYAREEFSKFLPQVTKKLHQYLLYGQEKKWIRTDCNCWFIALSFIPLLFQPLKNRFILKEFFNIDTSQPETLSKFSEEIINLLLNGILIV